MEVFLLNVMGSAAAASGIIAGMIATRLSKEIARSGRDRPPEPKQD